MLVMLVMIVEFRFSLLSVISVNSILMVFVGGWVMFWLWLVSI